MRVTLVTINILNNTIKVIDYNLSYCLYTPGCASFKLRFQEPPPKRGVMRSHLILTDNL